MQIKTLFFLISGLLLFISSPLLAHTGESGTGWVGLLVHPLTGLGHLLIIFIAAVGVVGILHWRRTPKR